MTGDARKSYSLGELAERFGGTVVGDAATRIRQVAPLETAGPEELSFLANRKYEKLLASTHARAVILGEEAREATVLPRIVCKNPYAYYARVAALVNPEIVPEPGIHPHSVVHRGAHVAPSAAVGAGAVIEEGARIGDGAVIGANCFVGRDARIGNGTRMYANATVYQGCVIGDRALIHSGAVIGADGFGMAMDEGRWLKIPQIGRVVVGDDVEVGANTAIDRGALDDTVIENGVKLDNQIQIGHNCHIGAHTAIAGCVGIAGSTRIGSYCQLGGSAMILGHLTIADHVVISAGTLVSKSIARPGTYTSVFPMSRHDDWRRNASLIRHLHEMMDRIRKLEGEIKRIKGK